MPGGPLATVWEIAARLPETKIVVLTVSDDDADLFAGAWVGVDGYLLKTYLYLNRRPAALTGVCHGSRSRTVMVVLGSAADFSPAVQAALAAPCQHGAPAAAADEP